MCNHDKRPSSSAAKSEKNRNENQQQQQQQQQQYSAATTATPCMATRVGSEMMGKEERGGETQTDSTGTRIAFHTTAKKAAAVAAAGACG